MLKKSVMATIVAMGMGVSGSVMAAAGPADGSTGQVEFNGRVTSNSCQLATSSSSLVVDLGEVKATTLQGGAKGPRQNFSIGLVDCDASTKSFDVTFEDALGHNDTANNQYLVNKTMGDGSEAQNVGVYLAHVNQGAEITLGEPQTIEASIDNTTDPDNPAAWANQTVSFDAYMAKPAGAAGAVTPGTVLANATVSIKTK
ncbi:type 1 fimbrial protein [Salmonella enterica subsp. enterica]|nr:type 1 fimbrial protein [Salmonella enterica subsp. enterica serovar Abaetetuba]